MEKARQMKRIIHRFTLSEVLIALLLVAVVLPVAVHAVLTANRAGVAASRRETAVRLANNKLQEIVLTDAWLDAEEAGEFEDEFSDYRWELESATWDGDTEHAMRVLTLRVFFNVQAQELQVRLSTLVKEPTTE
jgi:Tfp pilus assembly protein PilV